MSQRYITFKGLPWLTFCVTSTSGTLSQGSHPQSLVGRWASGKLPDGEAGRSNHPLSLSCYVSWEQRMLLISLLSVSRSHNSFTAKSCCMVQKYAVRAGAGTKWKQKLCPSISTCPGSGLFLLLWVRRWGSINSLGLCRGPADPPTSSAVLTTTWDLCGGASGGSTAPHKPCLLEIPLTEYQAIPFTARNMWKHVNYYYNNYITQYRIMHLYIISMFAEWETKPFLHSKKSVWKYKAPGLEVLLIYYDLYNKYA